MKNLRAKNRLLVFTAITAMLFAALFTACGSSSLEPVTDETTYTVTFATDGGSAIGAQKIAAGKTVAKPANPTKDGEIFEGWYKDSAYSAVYDFSAPVNSDITIYAKWSGTAHKVTFNTNGGSTIDAISVRHGDTPSMPSNPTKTGYDFKGWFKDAEFKEQYYLSSVTADLTLYAKWEVSVYLVSFDVDNGSSVSSQYIEHGGKVTKPADPTRRNCVFEGWYTAPYTGTSSDVQFNFTTNTITADTTIYAGWRIDGFTVSFVSNGGSAVPMQVLNKNGTDTAEEPAAPTRRGYNFMGWYSDQNFETSYNFSSAVSANTVLYAKWEIMKFEVRFIANGIIYDTQIVDYNKTVPIPPSPSIQGYDFDGWYLYSSPDPFNFGTRITSNTDIFAKLDIQSYEISFNSMEGTDVGTQIIQFGSIPEYEEPKKYGWTFTGWYTDQECTEQYNFTPVTGPMLLFAGWTPKICQVDFITLNGGTSIDSQYVQFSGFATEPQEEPERNGFTFDGWYTDLGYSQIFDFEYTKLYDDTTIYAKWVSTANVSLKAIIQIVNEDVPVTVLEKGNVVYFEIVFPTDSNKNCSGIWSIDDVSDNEVRQSFSFNKSSYGPGTYVVEWNGVYYDGYSYSDNIRYSFTALVTIE